MRRCLDTAVRHRRAAGGALLPGVIAYCSATWRQGYAAVRSAIDDAIFTPDCLVCPGSLASWRAGRLVSAERQRRQKGYQIFVTNSLISRQPMARWPGPGSVARAFRCRAGRGWWGLVCKASCALCALGPADRLSALNRGIICAAGGFDQRHLQARLRCNRDASDHRARRLSD